MIALAFPAAPGSGTRRAVNVPETLRALADRAERLVCAGAPCLLSAAILRGYADSWHRNSEGVRESLAKRLRGFDDPRFEALRTIYAEAVRAVGGEP